MSGRLLALICGAALAGLTWLVETGRTQSLDETIRTAVHRYQTTSATEVLSMVTQLGSVLAISLVTLAAFAVLWARGRRGDAWFLAAAMLGAIVLENGMKLILRRPRPEPFFGLAAPESFSFPSGHTLFSTACYGALALIVATSQGARGIQSGVWLLAGVVVAVIGVSRIYLGFHYPADVAGGLLTALGWLALLCAIWRRGGPPTPGRKL